MKERGRVGIALVYLVPQAGQAAGLDIAAHQRGLAEPGWCGDQRELAAKGLIEAAQEVGPSLFFSLLVITVGFLPVFPLQAQAGRLFKPLERVQSLNQDAIVQLILFAGNMTCSNCSLQGVFKE